MRVSIKAPIVVLTVLTLAACGESNPLDTGSPSELELAGQGLNGAGDRRNGLLATVVGVTGIINGGNHNDHVSGGAGNDTVDGGEGNDTVQGNKGDDLLKGSGGNDLLLGDGGSDALQGGDGDDILHGHSGADSYDGGGDNDTGRSFNCKQGDTHNGTVETLLGKTVC